MNREAFIPILLLSFSADMNNQLFSFHLTSPATVLTFCDPDICQLSLHITHLYASDQNIIFWKSFSGYDSSSHTAWSVPSETNGQGYGQVFPVNFPAKTSMMCPLKAVLQLGQAVSMWLWDEKGHQAPGFMGIMEDQQTDT